MGLIDRLLASDEPAIRLQVERGVLDAGNDETHGLREQVRHSSRVAMLLSERGPDGRIGAHPYHAKWYGAHWVLVTLAELGYPSGDESLVPLREQILGWLFSREYLGGLARTRGLPRLHGSIEGNALWSLLVLGLADERAEELARRLRDAQWPDGGWNCDRGASGRTSSLHESLIPLRALSLHALECSDAGSAQAAGAAAELFLRRRLFRRLRDGSVVHPSFVQLHYPCYWHYDVLFGLTVLAESGHIGDERCDDALDLVESKRLRDGGFPAEHSYYRRPRASVPTTQRSLVDWGGVSKRRANPWVSARACTVLSAAGRPVEHHV